MGMEKGQSFPKGPRAHSPNFLRLNQQANKRIQVANE